ncbi:polysaccharide deacetylase family protein [Winogradskya humida]|uniref:polysaccharide deacetylase family protein n=1 Tax=Winogradskya humida TaxID=113566 RepID=UPI001EF2AC06|nr:polysaccharide deacetylase family protein [Actinoplanes humidus]
MPPQPPKRTATGNAPRHAAVPAPRAHVSGALTSGTGGFPHVEVLEGETTLGRHRRPESLADPTTLRPAPTQRVAGGRRTSLDLTPRSTTGTPRLSTGQLPTGRSSTGPKNRAPRGRHYKAAEERAITVRPLSVTRSGSGPAIGSHRAPGTLPIESWLLIGRHRQQALLAALVAVGIMLIVFPMQQRDTGTEVDTITAGQAITTTAKPKPATSSSAPRGAAPATAQPATSEAAAPAPSAPPGSTPAAAAPSAQAASAPPTVAPATLVPAGTGPGQSLRTTGTNTVALTFDDGPDPVQTPKILALLDKYQVKATFCLVGSQVARHPEIVRDIVAAGHTLCNHTWDHSLTIGKQKPEAIQKDLLRTNEAIRAAVPGAEIPFFRAPGGNFSDTLVQTAYTDGMVSLYWQVDPSDWDHPDKESVTQHIAKVTKNIQENTKPGSIILSHDFNQPDTIKAYETLVPWLQERFALGLPTIPPVASAPAASPSASAPAL